VSDLTLKQMVFADEYLVDLNGKQAAIRCGYSEKTAEVQASRLLSNVKVKEYIAFRMKEREERTEITQDMVLKRWWMIATADPRKLIEYRRCACRYCYGKGHVYQWIDEAEFIKAYDVAVSYAEANADENHQIPDNEGGYGFNPTNTPHANCPKCFGRGTGEVTPHDTRTIDEQTAMLYAGVKVTKEGLEIKMNDQDAALENVAKHLGMFIDRKEHGSPGDFERLSENDLNDRLNAADEALRLAQAAIGSAAATSRAATKVK
jgi:phage terminase small subunit